jgi:methionyl-tRNA formyltransferase
MLMDEGLDTGPILSWREVAIRPESTAGSLTTELAELGAELLTLTLPRWIAGDVEARAQDDSAATHAPLVQRQDARLDWGLPADALERRVRAMNPWPGAFTVYDGVDLKIHRASVLEGSEAAGVEGEVVRASGGPAVATARGLLGLDEVQPAGGRRMSGADFGRGRPGFIGSTLAAPSRGAS